MRLLLLDTCGEAGSLAFAENGAVLRELFLRARSASAQLVRSVGLELEQLSWPLPSLDAVGVVSGPGSFTGVRVGLAAAKGLCEVAGLPLVTVSRLETLLSACKSTGSAIAVLDAGRGEFYARGADGREELLTREQLLEKAQQQRVLLADERLQAALEGMQTQLVKLSASSALPLVARKLELHEMESVEAADANYVRSARTLYAGVMATQPQGRA